MAARTGKQFLDGLRTPREVWVGGERVADATDHPAFRGAARTMAEVFDLQHTHAGDCLMPDPETGEAINASHMIPRSRADLAARARCLRRIAEHTVGLMGRTPDYMNVTYAGFAGTAATEWSINGNEAGAERLVAYQKFLRRNDLSLTHTIIPPTTDRAQGALPAGNEVALHRVEETSAGIVVRGARVLATLAPFADELAVYPGFRIPDDADRYALAFCIPMSTPGLKFVCRDSFATPGNVFDHPLSSRFDEQDAFVIFDDVEVPWDRVFINCNLWAYNTVMKKTWAANVMQQTMIRAQTKLEFAWGLATRMVESIGAAKEPPVQQMLGELWSYAEFTRACLVAAEAGATERPGGLWLPDVAPYQALKGVLPTWMARANEIIAQLGSHNLFIAPNRAELADPELGPLLARYAGGAGGTSVAERARIFRLAWDFVGSGLAGRNLQYERFYLGSVPRNLQLSQHLAQRERADRLVDRFLHEAAVDA